MRVPWLPDVLSDAGLRPRVLAGARGRGRDMATVYGVVVHDTVTPSRSWTNARVDALLRDGHSNLRGPLSQLGVDFDARPVVVADGRCNHNGYGTWGNDSIGIEVYCGGGVGPEPWTPAQREAVVAMSRAILAHLGLGRSSFWNPRVAGHKETDSGRKVDPFQVSVPNLRRDVARTVTAPPAPTPDPEEDIVASIQDLERLLDERIPDRLVRQRINEVTRLAEAGAGGAIAAIRESVGMKPDPASDRVHVRRIREGVNGSYTLVDVRKRLEDAAPVQADGGDVEACRKAEGVTAEDIRQCVDQDV